MHKQLDEFDIQAERESKAITTANQFRPHNPRLNRFYYCEGDRFGTGKKHRNGGYYENKG